MADPNTVLTRSTNFSKLENGQRVTTFSVRTNMKLGDGVSQVSIVDANGTVIAQGTAKDVAARLRANPSSRQNEDFIRAVETHDAGLQAARAKATPSQTAAEPLPAQSTTTLVDPTSDAAGKIDKGNTPPAVAPVDPAPNKAVTLPAPEEVASGRGIASVDITPPAEDRKITDTPAAAKSSAVESQKTNAEQSGKILGFNPLDELADYTYSFILSFLGPSDYNAIIRNPDSAAQYVKNNVIIASGSRNSETLKRNPEFTYDFFISELKFDTIVGLNSRTKGSNALVISFKIIEPMGVSFFDRLYEMARSKGLNNYLELPYLLVIEFRGNTDDGKPVVLKDHTKYIPIKLINANMRVTSNGSEYSVDAIPFSQVVYQATEHGSTPVNVQVQASTVGEFFANSQQINELAAQITTDIRETDTQVDILTFTTPGDIDLGVTTLEQRKKEINQRNDDFKKKFYNAKSYTQALNAFQLYLKEIKVAQQIDTYVFSIDPKIAESKIVDPQLLSGNRTANNNAKQGYFGINAGTSIVDAINQAMMNSDYIKDQIKEHSEKLKNEKDPTKIADTLGKPIRWYKIIPSVTVDQYDFRRNTFARTITYHIVPYLVHNTKSPLLAKSLPIKWLHDYDYIFTGNNRSILDCDIRFDVMFFQLATANKEQWDKWNTAPSITIEPSPISDAAAAGAFAPIKTIPVSTNIAKVTSVSAESAIGIAVTDAYTHLLSNMRGDMIGVTLKIVGDPRYIKQDEVFYNPGNSPTLELLSKNNSVLFDFEERYIKLTFNTPVDYGDNGLLAVAEKYKTSKFSGLYRILRIENVFQRGKFEQTLDLVRLFDQDSPKDTNKDSSTQREITREIQIPDSRGSGAAAATTPTVASSQPAVTESANAGQAVSVDLARSLSAPPTATASSATTNGSLAKLITSAPITEKDRQEALSIQAKARDPEAITAQQVANNRTLNERLTAAFGFKTGGTVKPPVAEDNGP